MGRVDNGEAVMKIKLLPFIAAGLLLACPPARADGTLEPPVPVRMVPPNYPFNLRRIGISGIVTVSCLIDEKGGVQDIRVVKTSNEQFSQPALDAVLKWKFKPANKGGVPVPLRINIPIQFNIKDD